MREFYEILKRIKVLWEIKILTRNETNAIAKKEGIRKHTRRYNLIYQDVMRGKPQILGDYYKIPN